MSSGEFQLIDPQALHDLLRTRGSQCVIDVRTPEEFAAVRVPEARNVPLDEMESGEIAGLGPVGHGDAVFILCRSGKRAQAAAAILRAAGFLDLHVVEGGTEAWMAAGLAVLRD